MINCVDIFCGVGGLTKGLPTGEFELSRELTETPSAGFRTRPTTGRRSGNGMFAIFLAINCAPSGRAVPTAC